MNDKQSYNNWLNNSNEYKAKENPHDEPMFKATNELMQDFNKQVKGYTKMLDENAKNGIKTEDKDIDQIFEKLDNSMKNIEYNNKFTCSVSPLLFSSLDSLVALTLRKLQRKLS